MGVTADERTILAAIDRASGRLVEVSTFIHAQRELGHEERLSAAALTSQLAEDGFEIEHGVAGLATAFRAILAGDRPSPAIALLAEYDALPGIGHACGHNLIAGATLGAALGLAAVRQRLPGTLHVLGTPAEEGYKPNAGGKVIMFEAGAFAKIDAALMVHPSDPPAYYSGGVPSLARDNFRLIFRGRRPRVGQAEWDFVNSQDALTWTHSAINILLQHIPPGVKVQWVIEKGGESPSIIPVESTVRVYVRAPKMATVKYVVRRIMECARGAVIAVGGEVLYQRHAQLYDEVITNRTLDDLFVAGLRDGGAPEEQVRHPRPERAAHSYDIGLVSKHLPVVAGRIVIGPREMSLHTKEAADAACSEAGHAGMLVGAKALALAAWRLMQDPELLVRARADLRAALESQA
jgi:amidohydrolase